MSCAKSNSDESSNNGDPDAETFFDVSLSVTEHPENTLMARTHVEVSKDAVVFIEFTSDETANLQTAKSDIGSAHDITVLGMRAETVYTMTAVATLGDGSEERSDPVSFMTGPLPDNAPVLSLAESTGTGGAGVTFFGIRSDASRYWGADEDARIVWYLHGDYTTASSPVLRETEPGELLIFLDDSIQTITTEGDTISINVLERWHHDVLLLPNGNTLMLGFESDRNEDGILLGGDTIIEQTADGDILWTWSSLEHLDTTRIQNQTLTPTGALDWTHSNALFYIEDDDSILLSVRSQSWVLKIDHKTGSVLWIMGDKEGTAPAYQYIDTFLTLESGTWMNSQHAAMQTADGEILIYDNRNESGGPTDMSRAVTFEIDESAKTARQTWEAVAPKYTGSLGDVDELSNGNVMMCAGGPGSADESAYIVEVSPDLTAETVWSMRVENDIVYRAERMDWNSFLNKEQ